MRPSDGRVFVAWRSFSDNRMHIVSSGDLQDVARKLAGMISGMRKGREKKPAPYPADFMVDDTGLEPVTPGM